MYVPHDAQTSSLMRTNGLKPLKPSSNVITFRKYPKHKANWNGWMLYKVAIQHASAKHSVTLHSVVRACAHPTVGGGCHLHAPLLHLTPHGSPPPPPHGVWTLVYRKEALLKMLQGVAQCHHHNVWMHFCSNTHLKTMHHFLPSSNQKQPCVPSDVHC